MLRHLTDRWKLISLIAAACLLAGVIAATRRYESQARSTKVPPHTTSSTPARSGSDGALIADLQSYVRSIGDASSSSKPAAAPPLPDVNTMIERLAARLETTPGDVKGWQMLGWSYFHTGRFGEAVAAYGKALELDPDSAQLRRSYEEAKSGAAAEAAKKIELK